MRLVAALTDAGPPRPHDRIVRLLRPIVLAWVLGAAPAGADPGSLAERWPSVPVGHALSLEDQITERLTQLGNELGRHLDLLSHDMFQLRVDGHHRRAFVRLGGGND